MKRKNALRNALFTSILSLLLCVSMLVSTTFAWFTDEVKSGQNVIAAGNLDVVLEYWNGEKYAEVTENTKLFNDAALWEPGHTEVAYLKVSNAGSLALKYQLAVNVYNETQGKTKDGNDIKLSDHLVFSVVEKQLETKDDMYSREAAITAAGTTMGLTAYNSGTTPLMPKDFPEVDKTEDYVALIIYMPTTVENEANHDGENVPSIKMGVHLTATQLVDESDSFGSEYDENAWVDGFDVYTEQDLNAALNNGETNIDLMDDVVLTKPVEIPAPAATTFSLRAAPVGIAINLNGKTITAGADGYAINNEKGATVTLGNGEIKGVVYNAAGSTMILQGGTYTAIDKYAILNDAATMTINGATINGTEKTYPIYSYNDGQNLVINDVTINGIFGALNAYGKGYVEINGGTFTMTGVAGKTSHIAFFSTNSEVVINGGSFSHIGDISMSAAGGGGVCIYNNANVTINGGTFCGDYEDLSHWGNANAVLNVQGGTFAHKPANVAAGYKAVANADGSYIVLKDSYTETVAAGVYKSDKGYGITTAEGFAWIEAQADNFFAGKTITLEADIDFAGATVPAARVWDPENKTVIDGNGKTLSNLVISDTAGNAGLFNGTFDVKNLTVDNATVTGRYAGVLAGNMYGNIDNCTVKNSTVNGTYWQTGMLCGQYNAGSITNCVVDNCTINGLSAVGALVGILNESAGTRTIANCTITNCAINQTGSFGGNYDNYFGVAVGLINTDNATIVFEGNTIENNTLKGAASDVLYGEAKSSNQVIVNGI